MNYALRALAVSISAFALSFILLRAATALAWQFLRKHSLSANSLYALLTLPVFGGLAVTSLIVMPAYLRFEPEGMSESVGVPVLVLTIAGLTMLAIGLTKAVTAWKQTSRSTRLWGADSATTETVSSLPVHTATVVAPPLAVFGLCRPQLLISSAAREMLTAQEFDRAVAHEVAHARHHDNLKKFTIEFCSVPGFGSLEHRWAAATEFEADNRAVTDRQQALDLASALIKVARLGTATAPLATNFCGDHLGLVAIRVERLMNWKANTNEQGRPLSKIAIGISVFSAAVLAYPALLVEVHRLSELLMR